MRLLLVGALGAMLLAGCATQDDSMIDNQTDSMSDGSGMDAPADTGMDGRPLDGSGVETGIIADDTLTAQELLADPESPLATRIIYFDYDSAKVSEESLGILEAHGNFIASNGTVAVRLEGHADERGSREYNIGLGDRRAQSVRRLLLFQGASSDQIDTISYGEEKPAMLGHDESAWAQNRRVELVYDVR